MSNLKLSSNGVTIPFTRSVFPGGEIHVRIDNPLEMVSARILANVFSSEDLMELLVLTDALRQIRCEKISLVMPYAPYARQDRVVNFGEALSAKVFANLINSQGYAEVEVWDCHSDVMTALIDRCVNVSSGSLLNQTIPRISPVFKFDMNNTIFVAPDAGAIKKVEKVSAQFKRPFVRADKKREPLTGAILETVVYSENVGFADFLIVDDICDGGRTFLELAKVLRPLTTGRIFLYVTHGIFSAGPQVFDGILDGVFVANSFLDKLPPNFVCMTHY